jgi:hypothetical protein
LQVYITFLQPLHIHRACKNTFLHQAIKFCIRKYKQPLLFIWYWWFPKSFDIRLTKNFLAPCTYKEWFKMWLRNLKKSVKKTFYILSYMWSALMRNSVAVYTIVGWWSYKPGHILASYTFGPPVRIPLFSWRWYPCRFI